MVQRDVEASTIAMVDKKGNTRKKAAPLEFTAEK